MATKCTPKDTKALYCVYAYAQNVTRQANPNAKKRNKWENVENCIGYNSKTVATSTFTRKKVVTKYKEVTVKDKYGRDVTKKVADKYGEYYNHPYPLASSDFHMEIPSEAYIHEIKFEVRMRKTGTATIKAPVGDFRVDTPRYTEKYSSTDGTKTGWYNGCYLYVPSENLTNAFSTHTYIMDRTAIEKGEITPTRVNRNIMGIDLMFSDAKFKGTGDASSEIQVEWIRCTIEYDLPNYKIKITNPVETAIAVNTSPVKSDGTEANPYHTNDDFQVTVTVKNKSKSKGSNRTVDITLPWGTELLDYNAVNGTFNRDTLKWTLTAKADATYQLDLFLSPQKYGISHIDATIVQDERSASYYYFKNEGMEDGYDAITITANGKLRKYTKSCVSIDVRGVSYDDTLTLNIGTDKAIQDGVFSLSSESDTGITLDSQTSTSATLTVPDHQDFHAVLNYCFYPKTTGKLNMTVTASDGGSGSNIFDVLASLTYVISNTPSNDDTIQDIILNPVSNEDGQSARCVIVNHRVVSELDSNNIKIPFVVDDGDSTMIMSDCSLGMSLFEELDYIGCVPLEHLHFDPKSTFKDTLLNSTYKNKRYMGKKLATDEDITLNVRLHPQQVTTIQGLIKMDKPIPINANHRCFEGDALNHRGWAEIYGIKTEETNPHWYKCDIDVKYLTHNLNTRFKIRKGASVNDYTIPSLMTETFSSGDSLSDDNLDEEIGESYFISETDGTYYYAEDYLDEDDEIISIDDSKRNNFNIDNGQYIRVKSRNPLTSKSSVAFNWSSTLLEEYRENNISRIVRLVNKTGNPIFEYEYDDITIVEDDEVYANVIYRVLEKDTVQDYNISKPITFRYSSSDVTYDNDEDLEDVIETGEPHYGSTLRLTVENNILRFVDEGFNGREISMNNIELVEDEYYYEVEWINKNDDAETSSVDCVFDFEVQDTVLTTTYSDKFGNLVVSPFPVTDKKILFTREAEEGTIYYYNDDGEEFSYLIDPYYQYMNGTDLVTSDGVSIFDLNYGYEVVYIQNGLVRLGFNRLTGYMFLGKYDPNSEQYITTHRFHLDKFDDVNLNMINDDKIEVQASDSTFTIYRGHPYIKIKHELEDIFIDTTFSRIWAEKVGLDAQDIPVYYDLMNTSNLLPECVSGGKEVKSSCIDVSEIDSSSKNPTELSWVDFPQNIILDNEANVQTGEISANAVTFTLDSTTLGEYTEVISLDDTSCSFGEYSVEIVSDKVPVRFDFVTGEPIISKSDVNTIGARIVDYLDYGVSGQTVNFYEYYDASRIDVGSDNSPITVGDSTNIVARVHDSDGSLIEGEYVVLSYEDKVDTSDWNISVSPSTLITQSGESMSFDVSVTDANNNPVENVLCEIIGRTGDDVIPDVPKTVGSVSLTGNNSVLSAYDEDTVTLTATVKDTDNEVIGGKSVTFKANGTIISSKTTNNQGVATYTYTATGDGDINFVASADNVSSATYNVEDCLLYDPVGFSKTTTSSTDTSYKSGYGFSLPSTENFEMEFDYNNRAGFRLYFASTNINDGETFYYGIGFTRDASGKLTFTERTTSTNNTTCQSISSGTNHYKVVFNGNVVNVWVNDVQQVSNKTLSWWSSHFPYYFNWAIWATGTGTVTNIKFKPL